MSKSIALVWLVILIIVAYLLSSLASDYRTAQRRADEQALSFVRLVEQHASSNIDRVDMLILDIMTEHVAASELLDVKRISEARRKEIEATLLRHQQLVAAVVSISLTDADGTAFANSLGAASGLNFADRQYFQILKADQRSGPVLSEAIKDRATQKWGIHIARRMELPDGRFGGMIVVDLGLSEAFLNFYETLSMGAHSLITLRDKDNRILVRVPQANIVPGQVIPGTQATLQVISGSTEGVATAVSPVDGIERIVGYRKLANYPVFAVVGIDKADAFASVLRERMLVASIILIVLFAGVLISHTLRRNARATAELEQAQQQLGQANAALTKALTEMEQFAYVDILTGLLNRRVFDQRLEERVEHAKRHGLKLSLLMFDLDHFKRINDTHGHAVGDKILSQTAELLCKHTRASDVLARWGGEEFVLIAESMKVDEAAILAEKLRGIVENHPFTTIGKLTLSVGVTEYQQGESATEFLRRSDVALYAAKNEGRNRVVVK